MRPLAQFCLALHLALTAPAQPLVLKNATIWPSPTGDPIRKGDILIEDGRISAVGRVDVPRGARVLDCTGLTVLPGFWNSHVHFFQRKWEDAAAIPAPELERQVEAILTRYGFTSAFDLGSTGANTRIIRDRIERGEVRGPRIRTTGEAIAAPDAAPPPAVLRMLGNMVPSNHEVTAAAQAAEAVRAILAAGNDGVKIHLQRPIPAEAIRAAIETAHRAGKPVFLHPSTREEALAAARAGVDVLAHTTPFSAWDAATVPALLEKKIAIVPTLTVWRHVLRHGRLSAQEAAVKAALAQLRSWSEAGGTVLFGNDLGAVEYDPTEEYELMSQAGLTFRQILASLTTAPAKQFGDGARLGAIAPGFTADLAIVQGDPTSSPRALAAVRYTIRDGRVIFRATR